MSERIAAARRRSLSALSREMVLLYWELGRHVIRVRFQEGRAETNGRAQRGRCVPHPGRVALTRAHGRGFSERNLLNFRAFYRAFPDSADASAELTWSHFVRVLRVESDLARRFYVKQCALDGWSTRELDRQINAMLFEQLALSIGQGRRDGPRAPRPRPAAAGGT